MPAKSKSQQRLFGMVHAYQKGKLKDAPESVKEIARSISDEDAEHFAKTKHKGLPEKKAYFTEINTRRYKMTAYERGFMNKCAEFGVDPKALVKVAFWSKLKSLIGLGRAAAKPGAKQVGSLGTALQARGSLSQAKPMSKILEGVERTNPRVASTMQPLAAMPHPSLQGEKLDRILEANRSFSKMYPATSLAYTPEQLKVMERDFEILKKLLRDPMYANAKYPLLRS